MNSIILGAPDYYAAVYVNKKTGKTLTISLKHVAMPEIFTDKRTMLSIPATDEMLAQLDYVGITYRKEY